MEGHVVRLAVTIHFDVQSGAQGIDHGGAHAVQATDGVIRRVAELGTGVQFGQYDLHAGQAGFRFLVHRDASAIVRDFHGTVGVQGDHNVVAEAGQGLVHGVVDDLPQAVHKPLRVGGADVHTAGNCADTHFPDSGCFDFCTEYDYESSGRGMTEKRCCILHDCVHAVTNMKRIKYKINVRIKNN